MGHREPAESEESEVPDWPDEEEMPWGPDDDEDRTLSMCESLHVIIREGGTTEVGFALIAPLGSSWVIGLPAPHL